MLNKVLYTTTSLARGGRDGTSGTVGGPFSVTLATPKELGGKGEEGVNPEQLFATGYAACFLSALKIVAARAGTPLPDDATISATVGIGPRKEGPGFGLDITLTASIPGFEKEVAQKLVETAHTVCPYSNAIRGNVDVALVSTSTPA